MSKKSYSDNLNDNIFDCLCIGTSILISLEALYQKKIKKKKILMVDNSSSIGGAWKTIEIDNIKNVENAIHYFTPNYTGIKFLKTKLNLPVEKSNGKYRYYKIFKNFYIRFLYDGIISRLLSAVFFSETPYGLSKKVIYIFKSILKILKNPTKASYYTASGSSGIIEILDKELKNNNIQIKLNTKIEKIFFDLQKKLVSCKLNNNQTILCRKLILGHGARLPKLDINDESLLLEEKFHPRPAYHLIVEDNRINNILEVIFANDDLIKYVHDVTRFSSVKDFQQHKTKVFVFALKNNIVDHDLLSERLFQKLKQIKLLGKNAKIKKSLFSKIILPTLYDEDLYILKKRVGNLVGVLRTENLTDGISYYSKRWENLL